jgi:hypothetical protein
MDKTVAEHCVTVKTCGKCKLEKLVDVFYKNKCKKDGLSGYCKECQSKTAKVFQEKNKARSNVAIPDLKVCSRCEKERASSSFSNNKINDDGLFAWCRDCDAVYKRESIYGVTDEWYKTTLRAQGNGCAICKTIPGSRDRRLCVDHSHSTDEIRGLLHGACNLGLGYFKDSVDIIERAVKYINCATHGIRYNKHLNKGVRNQILESQSYMCKICSADLRIHRACFDHCHKTNLVRGALCNECNCGLGKFNDSAELLVSAINYLKVHSSKLSQQSYAVPN